LKNWWPSNKILGVPSALKPDLPDSTVITACKAQGSILKLSAKADISSQSSVLGIVFSDNEF
jgi:hypothetical protein